jgi:hypothetical protein
MFDFHDISYAQGQYNMDGDGSPVVFMKMSGAYYGSKAPYYDDQASRNYNNAIRTGKLPGLYHFAGGGDPVAEADFFVGACSPLADGDLLILDYELTGEMSPPADPSAWCLAFVERVKERTGKYPLFYTYSSMLNQYGFDAVLDRCGLWIANYAVSPDGDVPTHGRSYIIHQYQGSPIDTNRCYISLETLRKYAYQSNQPQATPPAIPPTPEPTTTTTTTQVAPPAQPGTTTTTTTTTVAPDTTDTSTQVGSPPETTTTTTTVEVKPTLIQAIIAFLVALFNKLRGKS